MSASRKQSHQLSSFVAGAIFFKLEPLCISEALVSCKTCNVGRHYTSYSEPRHPGPIGQFETCMGAGKIIAPMLPSNVEASRLCM